LRTKDSRPLSHASNTFYPQIEGLRALAALLVAVYHIWMDRVSGGVDAFFVVSGFLITTTLLRQLDRDGHVSFFRFYAQILARLVPAGMVVLAFVLLASIFFLPEPQWNDTAREIIASAFYFQNWQLAFNAVDYLAQENLPSPVQHYWAMSIQGQFYLIWPLLFALSVLLARAGLWSFKTCLATLFLVLFSGSFVYSVYMTHWGNQSWAYFDTGARIWEFAVGALLALALPRLHVNDALRTALGWLGVVGIVATGVVIQGASMFPGYAALLPTLSAVAVMIAGASGIRWGAQGLITSRPMVAMGGMAYGIYLWHWPLLVFYRSQFEVESVSLVAGLLIIGSSIALAWATQRWIEQPIRTKRDGTATRGFRLAGTFLIPLVSLALVWLLYLERGSGPSNLIAATHPGAAALANPELPVPDGVPFLPDLAQVTQDRGISYFDGCNMPGRSAPQPKICIYGQPEGFERTLAVVGGSHSAHWLPALRIVAQEENWRILYSTRAACRFSAEDSGRANCDEYNKLLLERLIELDPDLVFHTANVRKDPLPPDGYLVKWEAFRDAGIRVFAVRDNPTMPFSTPVCLARNPGNPGACVSDRDFVLPPDFDASMAPDNVHVADLSDYFCYHDVCPAVVGNVIVYRDTHHLTASYVITLAPFLRDALSTAMYSAPAKQQHTMEPHRRYDGHLSCVAITQDEPSARRLVLTREGDVIWFRRGDYRGKQREFEFWEGHVQPSGALELTGMFGRPGNPESGEPQTSGVLTLSGWIRDDMVFLAGIRGESHCRFSTSIH
jgi:peptidoglycan/LPS O-acetylase OafA/YrhL